MRDPSILTSKDVAKLIDVGRSTVQRWIDAGDLKAFKTVGKHRRVKRDDLLAFLRERRMPIPPSLARKVRVLIIDDEPQYMRVLKTLLERADKRFDVELAQDGLDGLLAVGARHPDIVLLDATMDGWDGFEVCRRLKRSPETKDILVVGMSGRASNEEAFRKAGVDAFLQKPLEAQVVLAVVAWLGLGAGGLPG